MNKALIYTILPCLLFACNEIEHDTQAPTVNIANPQEGMFVKSGDTITLLGEVSDEELHELHLEILKQNDTLVYFQSQPVVHELQSYSINERWIVPTLKDTTAVVFSAEAHDHHEHATKKEIKFFIRP
ncbi:MAG: hypothetical protein ACKOXR_06670 [Bacteroidota bacterium]